MGLEQGYQVEMEEAQKAQQDEINRKNSIDVNLKQDTDKLKKFDIIKDTAKSIDFSAKAAGAGAITGMAYAIIKQKSILLYTLLGAATFSVLYKIMRK